MELEEHSTYSLPDTFVYDGITLTIPFNPEVMDKVKIFPFRDDDIMVASYPKSGEYFPFVMMTSWWLHIPKQMRFHLS